MDYQQQFKKVLLEQPHLILGKKGIKENKGFIEHASKLLKKHKVIKIKILKTALHSLSLKEMARELAKSTDSHLVDLRGRTIILSKKPII
ncbi:MAG: RNA-binding protein [Candidatus Lokiarchaeota archaeon]|nr:RNA-binding protein [Candidatus Lokiarchaeota archaeon]MBD3199943.1 RNA-binding protein [Candidatus Lokiarchaeota archaeon]